MSAAGFLNYTEIEIEKKINKKDPALTASGAGNGSATNYGAKEEQSFLGV